MSLLPLLCLQEIIHGVTRSEGDTSTVGFWGMGGQRGWPDLPSVLLPILVRSRFSSKGCLFTSLCWYNTHPMTRRLWLFISLLALFARAQVRIHGTTKFGRWYFWNIKVFHDDFVFASGVVPVGTLQDCGTIHPLTRVV